MTTGLQLSVVIPVYNEEAGLPALFARLYPALDALDLAYEVIFVNDGSRDRSAALLREQWQRRRDVTRVVLFNANYGQHTAIVAGFERCRGERVVTLDADLQNPPEEIAKLLAAMNAGHDYVGGVRRTREDSLWRRMASRAMNRLRERITRIRMTDQGCMLRAYSREIAVAVAASREVSTYIPALAYTFALESDRGRGRARGARGGRIEIFALQADPPQLRPHHRLFAGPAAGVLDVRNAGVAAGAAHLPDRHCVPSCGGELARHRDAAPAVGPRHPRVLPDRHAAFRAGARRRVRRAHLSAGARASALHGARGAGRRQDATTPDDPSP